MDAAGLQRGRLTGIALRGEDLIDAAHVTEQISLDGTREDRLRAEKVMDRIRDKYGPAAIGPAAAFRRAS
jgi:DNA polymerase-4